MLADGRLQQPAPLGAVVSDALRRWYLETEKEALRGDVVSYCVCALLLRPCVRRRPVLVAAVPGVPVQQEPARRRTHAISGDARFRAHPRSSVSHTTPILLPARPQKAQALLGQMLIEGYGCEADPVKGREWAEKARRRGYRMDGAQHCCWPATSLIEMRTGGIVRRGLETAATVGPPCRCHVDAWLDGGWQAVGAGCNAAGQCAAPETTWHLALKLWAGCPLPAAGVYCKI